MAIFYANFPLYTCIYISCLKSYSYIFYGLKKNIVKKANTEQNEHPAPTEHTPQL